MCVPVKLKCSRSSSTRRVRGSTSASRGSPLTRTRTGIFSTADIFVTCLNLFTARSSNGNSDGALDEGGNQHAFIICGAAHIVLRLRRGARSFDGALDPLFVKLLAAQEFLRFFRADGHQTCAAQHDPDFFAGVTVTERKLHCRASRRIDRSAALECQIGAATSRGRLFDDHLTEQFVVAEDGGVGILEKIIKRDGPLTGWAGASNRRV